MPRNIHAIREKYGSTQIKTLVEGALIRPQMYIMTPTVFEIVAFLDGYYSAAARNAGGFTHSDIWWSFQEWLISEIGGLPPADRAALFKKVKELHPNDDSAFDYLLDKFLQFQQIQKGQLDS